MGARHRAWPAKDHRDAGEALRDVAREYWGFGYDPSAGTVSLGPYTIQVDKANQAAKDLSFAIYQAAREVDQASAADLFTRTVEVLNNAGISCASTSSEEVSLWVRVKDDSRVWLSLTAIGPHKRGLSEQVVSVLGNARLCLVSNMQAENLASAERLLRGEVLYVELNAV